MCVFFLKETLWKGSVCLVLLLCIIIWMMYLAMLDFKRASVEFMNFLFPKGAMGLGPGFSKWGRRPQIGSQVV